ncbi:MAG: hypothetical protein JXR96_27050 [Deltaproteobacteria bacterium]|nr:hypothetical protein [Deltaproteobacteria bacterium]
MKCLLPFEHLNLRWNPFGCLPLDQLGALALIDLPAIRPGEVWQLIGDKGHGKTTRLLGLVRRLPRAIYEYVSPERPRVRSSPRGAEVLLLDEAQRLSPRRLRRALRRFETIVLGTHEDLRPRAGRAIRTQVLEGMSRERLARIFERRIEHARLGPGRLPRVSEGALDVLLERHGADVRAMEGVLYDAIQRMEEMRDVEL